MYSTTGNGYSSADSKYTVADILSSMSNGDAVTPTTAYVNGMSAANILTPTTLTTLEQSFVALQSNNHQDRNLQSGFVPPVVDVNSPRQSEDDPDWRPPSAKKAKGVAVRSNLMREEDIYTPGYLSTSRRPPGKKPKHEDLLSQDEYERRIMRRERNKIAAAKCRQRRVDQTNTLLNETEELEDEKTNLENEIHSLQQQKEQLEFLLKAHKPVCKKNLLPNGIEIKSEPTDINETVNCNQSYSRPNSLSFATSQTSIRSLGVPITTPSNGIVTLGLDSMLDGHTGLTPIMSCSSQHNSKSHSQNILTTSESETALNSPTLISL